MRRFLMAGLLVAATVGALLAQGVAPLREYTVTLAEGRARMAEQVQRLVDVRTEISEEHRRDLMRVYDMVFQQGWRTALVAADCQATGVSNRECAALVANAMTNRGR